MKQELQFSVRKPEYQQVLRQTEMQIFFLLEGTMTLRYQEEIYEMIEEDFLLIQPGVSYEILEGQDALYAVAEYSMSFLSTMLPQKQVVFFCNSILHPEASYEELRTLFYDMVARYSAASHETEALIYSDLYQVFDRLVEHFQMGNAEKKPENMDGDARMREIMQYIMINLDQDLSLQDLADQMFVSKSTLSRVFKKHTGVYFADYVMQLRVQMALPLLRHTSQSVTAIALASGFSNSASFNRAFRKVMQVTPMEYRKTCINQEDEGDGEQKIRLELREKGYEQKKQGKCIQGLIDLSIASDAKCKKNWNQIINIGSIYDLTKANVQYHAVYLNQQLHYRYLRIWNVFSKRMMLFDGQNIGRYNYDLIDQVLDFMVQHKLKPFLDFGRRPDVALSSMRRTVYYEDDYIAFQSREAWESLVADFLNHIVGRYGLEEVSDWIFELTRDGDHSQNPAFSRLYQAGDYDFFDAFAYFHHMVKKKIPSGKFGGFGAISLVDSAYMETFFQKCQERQLQPDFLSVLIFPYEMPDGASKAERRMTKDVHHEEMQLQQIRSLQQRYGMDQVPLYVTEWNNSISNRNYLNDSCFRSSYMIRKLCAFSAYAEQVCLMSGTDWVSSYMDTVGIVNGGIGLLTKDTIKKPAYYALEFMNHLGDEVLVEHPNYLVTRKENGEIYMICYYYSWFKDSYYRLEEDVDYRHCDQGIFQDETELKLQLRFKGFSQSGKYAIRSWILNREHGSILHEWSKFQFSTKMTRQDVKYLEAKCMPDLLQEEQEIRQGQDALFLDITLQPHEVRLLRILPEET